MKMPLLDSEAAFFSLDNSMVWSDISHTMTAVNNLSGQQKADKNHTTFLSWVASKTDADFREMVLRGQLNRKEIARECDFAKSVLLQNPRVKDALRTLEGQLRERDVSAHFDTY